MSKKRAEKQQEWARKARESVTPFLDGEEVEAVGEFSRAGRWWSEPQGVLGRLLYEVMSERARGKEGGLGDLPEFFWLVVTKDKLHAFSHGDWRRTHLEDHVAEFPRESISFSREMGTGIREVGVLELNEEGRKTRIQVRGDVLNPEKNPLAAEVVALLTAQPANEVAGLQE